MDKGISKNDGVSQRRFSCFFIAVAMLFALSTVLVIGFLTFKDYAYKVAFYNLTSQERAEFNRWAYTPVESTPFVSIIISPETIEAKQRLKDAGLAVDQKFPKIRLTSYSIADKLLLEDTLTPEEWDAVTTFTLQFAPVVDLGHQVIGRSDFAMDGNQYPRPEDPIEGWSVFVQLLCVYIESSAQTSNWDNTTKAIELGSSLTGAPNDADFVPLFETSYTDQALLQAVRRATKKTSDTVILRRILQALSSNGSKSDSHAFVEELPVVFRQMQAEGFVRPGKSTQMFAWYTLKEQETYLKWLVRKLPESPRKALAKKELESAEDYLGSGPLTPALKVIISGPVKPLLKPLIRLNLFPTLVRNWKYMHKEIFDSKKQYTYENLFLLHLARRIAQLEGKPLPTTADDFVPEYLPHFPDDVFSIGPLSHSKKSDVFFSVGPDGIGFTADDITWPPGP